MGNAASSQTGHGRSSSSNNAHDGNDDTQNTSAGQPIRRRRNQMSRMNPLQGAVGSSTTPSSSSQSSSITGERTPRVLRHLRRISRNAQALSASQNSSSSLDPMAGIVESTSSVHADVDMEDVEPDMSDFSTTVPHPLRLPDAGTGGLEERILAHVVQEILSGIVGGATPIPTTRSGNVSDPETATQNVDTGTGEPTSNTLSDQSGTAHRHEASITFLMAVPQAISEDDRGTTNQTDTQASGPAADSTTESDQTEDQGDAHAQPNQGIMSFFRNFAQQLNSRTRRTSSGQDQPTAEDNDGDQPQGRSRVMTVVIIRPVIDVERNAAAENVTPQPQLSIPEPSNGEGRESTTDTQSASEFAAVLQAILRRASTLQPPQPQDDLATEPVILQADSQPETSVDLSQPSNTAPNANAIRQPRTGISPLHMLLPLLAGDGTRDGSDYEALTQLAALLGNVRPNTANETDLAQQLPEYTFSSGTLVAKIPESQTKTDTSTEQQNTTSSSTKESCSNADVTTPIGGTNDKCTICLMPYEEGDCLRLLRCSHAFHKDCLDQWLITYKNSCPLCRSECVQNTSENTSENTASDNTSGPTPFHGALSDLPPGSVVMFVSAQL